MNEGYGMMNNGFSDIALGTTGKYTPDATAVRRKYERITKTLIEKKLTVTTMESCTAGLIASLLTDTEGASAVLKGAFVTYSNEAKIMQGVPAGVIREYGVYSEETAVAMAKACKAVFCADLAVGVTGTFGNADPKNPDGVPGTVFFAVADRRGARGYRCGIPSQPSRYAYKLFTADVIADRMLQILSESSED